MRTPHISPVRLGPRPEAIRPPPLRQYVMKVHSRCDLACDHCYIYQHADQSWRGRPRAIAAETVRVAAERIAEHARVHRLPQVRLVLHGGEPLLLGEAGLRAVLARLRDTIIPVTGLDLRLQSNGVRLSDAICELFVEYGVRVGISLDGDGAANDLHRRFANGGSSHRQVREALRRLRSPAYRSSYAGILCTIDLRNDPIRVYEALVAEEPPQVDLLLPHATWTEPPSRTDDAGPTPYADWLARIYRRWVADGQPMPIRLFDSLAATRAGRRSGTEAVGLEPADVAVIETDGEWELPDSMKTAYHGAAATRLDVFRHSVDEVAAHPGIQGNRNGVADLCRTCRRCPVVRQCGGGLRAHRYRAGSGFDNPSVYCADLLELATVVNRAPVPVRVVTSTPDGTTGQVDRRVVAYTAREHNGDGAMRDGPIRPVRPSDRLLDDLAGGHGSAEHVAWLARAQLGITRALLVHIGTGLTDAPSALAWRLICRLEREAPHAVEAVFVHPYTQPWVRRRVLGGGEGPAPQLVTLAAAAAVGAGVEVDIEVPVRAGLLELPGLGTLAIEAAGAGSARLRVGADGFAVAVDGGERRVRLGEGAPAPAGWRPARRISLDHETTILFDDLDPYRDCYGWPVADRLGAPEAAAWGGSLTAAWSALRRDAPGQVPGLRTGLRAVTPLRPDPGGTLLSATSRLAFGAVGVEVAGPDALAELLVHEFQHVKLGALLDVCRLVHEGEQARLVVPWRDDPRPVEGGLQGTYAHLAIADLWRARSGAFALAQFHRYRSWTVTVAERLLRTGALTADGERFVRRMRETVEGWSGGSR